MSDVPAVLLFLGPEEGLKSDEIESLRKKLQKTNGEAPDEHRYYLPADSIADVIDTLRNGSLFSAHRLVILAGVEQLKKKTEIEPLTAYMNSPNPDATLILLSDSIRVESRLEKSVPGSSRKVFWEMFENQKGGWVRSYFRKRKTSITDEAVDLFLEIVENNTLELRNEADKLCTFVGPGGEVDVEEVETFIYHSREESVFTLFHHITNDSFEAALTALDKIISGATSSPIQVIGGLVFQFRRLLALRIMLDNDLDLSSAFSRLNIRGKRIQSEYRTAAGKVSVAELERHIYTLTEYDALFRSSRPGIHPCLLDLMVYQLMFHSQRLVRPLGLSADKRLIAEDDEDLVLVR